MVLAACSGEPPTLIGSGSPVPTAIQTATPTPTMTPTQTPVPTATPSTVPTATPTQTPTPIATPTPTPTQTATPTPTMTPTQTPVHTAMPSPVPLATPTQTPTPTATPTPTPTLVTDFTKPQIYNDNVYVMPVTENLAGGEPPLKDYAVHFYERFDDEFDFLVFVSNVGQDQHEPGAYVGAFHVGVQNDAKGIGMETLANNEDWGSAGRLQGAIFFGSYSIYHDHDLSIFAEGPTLHELMHQWANFVVPSAWGSHWGFSSADGNLGGFDIADLVKHGGGRYSAGGFTVAGAADNIVPYSPIELYLAGFVPPDQVPDKSPTFGLPKMESGCSMRKASTSAPLMVLGCSPQVKSEPTPLRRSSPSMERAFPTFRNHRRSFVGPSYSWLMRTTLRPKRPYKR